MPLCVCVGCCLCCLVSTVGMVMRVGCGLCVIVPWAGYEADLAYGEGRCGRAACGIGSSTHWICLRLLLTTEEGCGAGRVGGDGWCE